MVVGSHRIGSSGSVSAIPMVYPRPAVLVRHLDPADAPQGPHLIAGAAPPRRMPTSFRAGAAAEFEGHPYPGLATAAGAGVRVGPAGAGPDQLDAHGRRVWWWAPTSQSPCVLAKPDGGLDIPHGGVLPQVPGLSRPRLPADDLSVTVVRRRFQSGAIPVDDGGLWRNGRAAWSRGGIARRAASSRDAAGAASWRVGARGAASPRVGAGGESADSAAAGPSAEGPAAVIAEHGPVRVRAAGWFRPWG